MGKLPMTTWLCEQRRPVAPVQYGDVTGKTILVIGGNGGIGFEACKHFARMKPGRLILACRSAERGAQAVKEIETETEFKAQLMTVDLANFASVREFVDKYETEMGRLDVLVENAALGPNLTTVPRTVDGWESTLQVNDLSTALLAILLLPTLLRTAETHRTNPRLVVVSSDTHFWTSFAPALFEAPNPLRTFNGDEYSSIRGMRTRYMDTKLLNVLFVRALADRIAHSPIIVNTVNPRYCTSGLRSSLKGIMATIDGMFEKMLAHTPEEGSRELVWAASCGDNDALRGAYISDSSVCEPSDWVLSKDGARAQERFWDDFIEELSLVDPRVKTIVNDHLASK